MLQVQSRNTYISAYYSSPVLMRSENLEDTDQQFVYISSTMQIHSPVKNLCLDDGGRETLGLTSYGTVFTFSPCVSNNINQQFVFTTNNQIVNPNWPNNKLCLNGNGNEFVAWQKGNIFSFFSVPVAYRELIQWGCSSADSNEVFNIILLCPPGEGSLGHNF